MESNWIYNIIFKSYVHADLHALLVKLQLKLHPFPFTKYQPLFYFTPERCHQILCFHREPHSLLTDCLLTNLYPGSTQEKLKSIVFSSYFSNKVTVNLIKEELSLPFIVSHRLMELLDYCCLLLGASLVLNLGKVA